MDYTELKPKYLDRMNKLIEDLPMELPKSFVSEARKIIHELAAEAWDKGHESGFNSVLEFYDDGDL